MTNGTSKAFSFHDHQFMAFAIEKATEALRRGDFPVGAVLIVDGICMDSESNTNNSDWNWNSHAEHKLLLKHSSHLRNLIQHKSARVELFCTVEPCLMCLGAAVFNRVRRIVYALSDPSAGAASLHATALRQWYRRRWPQIQTGLLKEQSEALVRQYRPIHPQKETKAQSISESERARALDSVAERARQAGIELTCGSDIVNVSYSHAAREGAVKLAAALARLGFRCTWSSSVSGGEDEVWTLAACDVTMATST